MSPEPTFNPDEVDYFTSGGKFTYTETYVSNGVVTFNQLITVTAGANETIRILGRINPTGSTNTTRVHYPSGTVTVSFP